MSDRIHSFTVVLNKDIRDDDFEQSYMAALKMMKGVIGVTPNISDMNSHMAEMRAKQELKEKLWDVLK